MTTDITNKNEQLSRGEQSENIKNDFAKSRPNSESESENFANDIVSGAMYVEPNDDLDAMLDDATTTQEQHAQNEKAETKVKQSKMSVEQAMDISLKGLVNLTKMAGDYSGREIEVNQSSAMIFATLTAPLIMKYGARFSFDPNNIDLDSWMPEMMAVGGVAVVGYPMFKQMQAPVAKNVNKAAHTANEGAERGN